MESLDQALNSLSSFLDELPTLCKGEPPLEIDAQSDWLTLWRKSVSDSLDRLKDATRTCYGTLTTDQRARIASTAAVLIGQDNFTDEGCRTRAKGCLDDVGVLDKDTASRILANYVKPLFQASTHPGVNLDTGRVKHNPLSVQNMYDDQPWKIYGAGCWNVMSWVLSHIQNEDIETLWPLIIPPLLTLVDDYKPLYRIRGVHVTQALLGKVSASLLRRTGIDELISKALRGSLQNLTSDEAPMLLTTAMPCYLALVDLVSPNDDEKRFNKLSQLVTEVIVPGWLYASSKIDVMVASVKCLQLVVQSLGAGSIRFLKIFIPQLAENLYPREFSPIKPTRDLQNASAGCLLVVMKHGRPRVPHWRLRILDAVLRCWVDINGTNSHDIDDDTERLKALLVNIFCELFSTSGHLLKDEVVRLQELDTRIFSGLLGAVQPRSAEELGLVKPQ